MSDRTLVAFTSFFYTIKFKGFCGSTTVRLCNAGDRAVAYRSKSYCNKAGGRLVPGLTARRARDLSVVISRQGAAWSLTG
jgi:lysozyme